MNTNRNKILVAVDFEEQSLTALEQAYPLARLFNAGILLLYVIEEGSGFSRLISPDEYHRKVLEKAREKFDEIEQLALLASHNQELRVSYQIKKGKPYQKILETASDHDALLIVMGKGGREGKRKKGFFGSNTLNVVRQAACPVITLTAGHMVGEFENILMPIDFTGRTKVQVQQAIELGKYFGATINVLSVINTENKITRILKQVQLTQVKNALQRHDVSCNTHLLQQVRKQLSDEICTFALDHKSDLIIIMTQQKKQFSTVFIGSTAQEIIYCSPLPVMSINPGAHFHPEVFTSFVDPLGLMKSRKE